MLASLLTKEGSKSLGSERTLLSLSSFQIQVLAPVVFLLSSACTTSHPPKLTSIPVPHVIKVERDFLETLKVASTSAQLREGPSVSYMLTDELLEKNQVVIVLARISPWIKVLEPKKEVIGWAHKRTLEKHLAIDKGPISIRRDLLPRVFAVKSMPSPLKKNGKIPILNSPIFKGQAFYSLKSSTRRTLVWEPQSQKVFWLSQQDVK